MTSPSQILSTSSINYSNEVTGDSSPTFRDVQMLSQSEKIYIGGNVGALHTQPIFRERRNGIEPKVKVHRPLRGKHGGI
jgi:hypothetical protein